MSMRKKFKDKNLDQLRLRSNFLEKDREKKRCFLSRKSRTKLGNLNETCRKRNFRGKDSRRDNFLKIDWSKQII